MIFDFIKAVLTSRTITVELPDLFQPVGGIAHQHRILPALDGFVFINEVQFKTDQTRRIVRSAVAEVLDRELPVESYGRVPFQNKCDNVFHLLLDYAAQGRKSAA